MRDNSVSPRARKSLLLLLLLLSVAGLGAIRENHNVTEISWLNLGPGLQQARQKHKLLLISFHKPDSGWCAKMDAETFADPVVVELAHHFVCVRLESDAGLALPARYRVHEYPLILIADSQGTPLARISGYTPPESLARALRSVASH